MTSFHRQYIITCLYKDVLLLTDVRWPSSNPVVLNTGSRWTESVRDPNTVARDLLSRMVKLLKGIITVNRKLEIQNGSYQTKSALGGNSIFYSSSNFGCEGSLYVIDKHEWRLMKVLIFDLLVYK